MIQNTNIFFFFSLLTTGFALGYAIVLVSNPIFAVMILICLFICTSILLLTLGLEFLAVLYILIYVGAVLILFLWIVMIVPVERSDKIQFKTAFVFLLIFSICAVLFNFLLQPSVKLVAITPDNILFNYFVKWLQKGLQLNAHLILSESSKPFIELSQIYDEKFVKVAFVVPVPKNSYFQTIFMLHAAKLMVIPYPITENSFFFVELQKLYNASVVNCCLPDKIAKYQYFLHAISDLNTRRNFTVNPNVLGGKHHVMVLFQQPMNFFLFNLPGITASNYIFVSDQFLVKYPWVKQSLLNLSINVKFNCNDVILLDINRWLELFVSGYNMELKSIANSLYVSNSVGLVIVGLILLISMVGATSLVYFHKINERFGNASIKKVVKV